MSSLAKKEGDHVNWKTLKTCTSAFSFQYIWEIENVIKIANNEILESPTFRGNNKSQDVWKLKFRLVNDSNFQVALQLVESDISGPIKGDFKICFTNSDDKVIWADTLRKDEFVAGQEGTFFSVLYKTVLLNSDFGFLTNGKRITIFCQVTTYEEKFFSPYKRKHAENREMIKRQMKVFVESGECSEVTIKTESSSFGGSKMILAAHSPVFRTMFNVDMVESKDNIIMIDDFPDDVVMSFLEYMHTGGTETLEENALELLKIAEKYNVACLKEKCEDVIVKEMSIANSAAILITAYLFSPVTLKPKVVEFVNLNIGEIKKTDSFKEMQRTHPQIFVDLFAAITEG